MWPGDLAAMCREEVVERAVRADGHLVHVIGQPVRVPLPARRARA
jgi:hypothetical protein